MRTPDEAIAEILRRIEGPRSIELLALQYASDRVLARDVVSDIDVPPFEKSAMDGFAVKSSDCASDAPVRMRVVGESRAGAPFRGASSAGECVAIYTGAEVPRDTDAVVMVEKTRIEGECVVIESRAHAGMNVCHRGEDLRTGAIVSRAGRRLSPIDLAALAAVGCEPVPVHPRARVALLTTGDELVPVAQRPGPGQIREGNTFYLAARARAAHAEVDNRGIVPDDEERLQREIESALETCDVLITTGGVSMGRYDIVGAVLERCGVEAVFHKVAIKPGKPLWFGMRGRVPVFALPGNPVSCLIGFEVFVRPALAKMEGAHESEWSAPLRRARWMGQATETNPRQQNVPCRLREGADGVDELHPLAWKSSADIVGLTRAHALAVIEAHERASTNQLVRYRPLVNHDVRD